MKNSFPKLDSHVIDYFLSLAEHMENQLDDQTYASVKRIFGKNVLMLEELEDQKSSEKIDIDSIHDL